MALLINMSNVSFCLINTILRLLKYIIYGKKAKLIRTHTYFPFLLMIIEGILRGNAM